MNGDKQPTDDQPLNHLIFMRSNSINDDRINFERPPQVPPLIKMPSQSIQQPSPNMYQADQYDLLSQMLRSNSIGGFFFAPPPMSHGLQPLQPFTIPNYPIRQRSEQQQLLPQPQQLQTVQISPPVQPIPIKGQAEGNIPSNRRRSKSRSREKEKEKEHQKEQKEAKEPKEPKEPPVFVPCTCSKTNCLKMYCSCFHEGKKCRQECQCSQCKNVEGFEDDIKKAVDHVKKKAQRNHVQVNELFKKDRSDTCNCKKTKCQKRYCECYLQKKKCTQKCQCEDCENGKDDDLIQQYKNYGRSSRRQKTQ